MYDILWEFDRRHNFTSDDDLLNYSKLLMIVIQIIINKELKDFYLKE